MSNEEKKPETLQEAVEIIYNDWGWKDNEDFMSEIKALSAKHFASKQHMWSGMAIRNEFNLWNSDTPLFKHMKELGAKHPDDMSNRILIEVYKYAHVQLKKAEENEEAESNQ